MVMVAFLPQHAHANPKYASIVMDADTGLILHQRHADKSLHPASLTKVMTLIIVFDELKAGRLNLNSRVRISERAAGMVPSKLNLPVGSSIRVKDAIYALVTKSANDIAVALAEHISGSEWKFAQRMTRRANQLGMNKTQFRNASGLHDERQVSTARDMAKMARVILTDYRDYYHYFSTKNFSYRGKSYHNHNRLMSSYKGMDGIKTGYIRASGFNLIASAAQNNKRLIGVVFGGRSSKTRNAHMQKLLDRAFARINEIRTAYNRAPLPPKKPAILTAVAALNDTMRPIEQGSASGSSQWASLNQTLQGDLFSRLIGEGDLDMAESRRLQTGLVAVAAHKGEPIPDYSKIQNTRQRRNENSAVNGWAIQIGAFTSRTATDAALRKALASLPRELSYARPAISPLRTNSNTLLFRARLSGYNASTAQRACAHLNDCLVVPPAQNP